MRTICWRLFFAVFLARAQAQEMYSLTKRSEEIPERGTVESYAWRTEEAVLSFIPPANWEANVKISEKKLSLRYLPFLSGLTLHVLTNAPGSIPSLGTAEELHKQIIAKFPNALIREEFTGYSPAGPGPVIDIEIPAGGARTCHRVAWIPFKRGVVEIELISPEKYFAKCHGAWSLVLGSFRTEPARNNSR